jgi:hypothetical protein
MPGGAGRILAIVRLTPRSRDLMASPNGAQATHINCTEFNASVEPRH